MKRGDVFWATLDPRSGSEQAGRRPVIVISHDAFNEAPNWMSVTVIPLSTSENQAKRNVTTPFLAAGIASLPRDCVAICHQITTLDRSKLTKRIGRLPSSTMKDVEAGLRASLDLDG